MFRSYNSDIIKGEMESATQGSLFNQGYDTMSVSVPVSSMCGMINAELFLC